MATKHTPGPWKTFAGYDGRDTIAIMRSADQQLCIVSAGKPHGFEATTANASLIAAAPDLLAALTRLLRTTELNLDEVEAETGNACEAAHAAILKATKGI